MEDLQRMTKQGQDHTGQIMVCVSLGNAKAFEWPDRTLVFIRFILQAANHHVHRCLAFSVFLTPTQQCISGEQLKCLPLRLTHPSTSPKLPMNYPMYFSAITSNSVSFFRPFYRCRTSDKMLSKIRIICVLVYSNSVRQFQSKTWQKYRQKEWRQTEDWKWKGQSSNSRGSKQDLQPEFLRKSYRALKNCRHSRQVRLKSSPYGLRASAAICTAPSMSFIHCSPWSTITASNSSSPSYFSTLHFSKVSLSVWCFLDSDSNSSDISKPTILLTSTPSFSRVFITSAEISPQPEQKSAIWMGLPKACCLLLRAWTILGMNTLVWYLWMRSLWMQVWLKGSFSVQNLCDILRALLSNQLYSVLSGNS